MTIENEKRFLLLLSSFIQGNTATKSSVLDYIEEQDWIILSTEDYQIRKSRNELIWRNDLAYVRNHLTMEGLFVSNRRNDWSITEDGKGVLSTLFQEVLSCFDFCKIKNSAILAAKEILLSDVTAPVLDSDEFSEGKAMLKLHLIRERNQYLITKSKQKFKEEHGGRLYCEVCGFDFSKVYGELGEGFIEAHHTKPVSTMQPNETTKIEDMVMLCSNCHSMIHRKKPWTTKEKIKTILKK